MKADIAIDRALRRRGWGPLACTTAFVMLARPGTATATPNVAITAETLGVRFQTATNSGSYAHAVPNVGANRALIVTVGVTDGTAPVTDIGSVVWDPDTTTAGNEQTLSCPTGLNVAIGTNRRIVICTLLNPTTSAGNGQVTVTLAASATDTFTSSATTFSGISGFRTESASPAGRTFSSWPGCTAITGGYSCSLSATTQADDVLFDLVGQGEPAPEGSRSFTAASGQTKHDDRATLSAVAHIRVATSTAIATGTSTTMAWTYGGATSANGVGHVILPMIPASSVTAATVGRRGAVRHGALGTQVTWQTEEEASHLGFQVWRERDGRRERVTAGLLPGSMFATGDFPLGGRRPYAFWDEGAPPGSWYWLEEIPSVGPSRWHGPIVPDISAEARARPLRSAAPPPARPSVATGPVAAPAHAASRWVRRSALTAPADPACKNPAAAGPAVKIGVSTAGWVRVDGRALREAGLPPEADPSRLALYADGREVAINVLGDQTVEAIEFHGRGVDTRETSTRVYWLVQSPTPGRRLMTAPRRPGGPIAPGYPARIAARERTIYFAALLNGAADNFFGPVLSDRPLTRTLAISAAAAGAPGTLEVVLQGATFAAHRVTVSFDGTPLGEMAWSGRAAVSRTFDLPAELIRDGERSILLTPAGGAESVTLVSQLAVTYARRYEAVADAIEAVADAGATVRLSGFTAGAVRVVDLSDPASPLQLPAEVVESGGQFEATVSVPADGGERTLFGFTSKAVKAPDSVRANRPSSLCNSRGGELAVVAPGELAGALAPYLEARRRAGWDVELADIEDLYDEMTFGAPSAGAITAFVRLRRGGRAPRTKYLLLVGDASVDPRNFLGKGVPDQVPTRLIDTDSLETASDDALADLDGDGVPEVAVGRWPARTPAEVEVLAARTLAFDGRAPFDAGALVVAGASRGFDFAGPARQVAAALPAGTELLDANALPGGAAKGELTARWSAGPSFVQYLGHGSQGTWEGLLSTEDAVGLGSNAQPAVVSAMTCLNAFFHDVYQASLAEQLLLAGNGAVAVWASAGLDDAGTQAALALAFARESRVTSLGEAVRRAKGANAGAGRTMVLLGDPTLFGTPTPEVPGQAVGGGAAQRPSPVTDHPAPGAVVRDPLPARGDGCAVATLDPGGSAASAVLALAGLLLAFRRPRCRRREKAPR